MAYFGVAKFVGAAAQCRIVSTVSRLRGGDKDIGADGEEDGATFAVCTKTKYHLRRRRKRRADEKVPVFRLLC